MSDAFARFERHQIDKQIVPDGESEQGVDPWERLLRHVERRAGVIQAVDRDGNLEWRTKSRYLLTEVIGIPPERMNTAHGNRLSIVMRKLGWTGPKDIRFGKTHAKGYTKPSLK